MSIPSAYLSGLSYRSNTSAPLALFAPSRRRRPGRM